MRLDLEKMSYLLNGLTYKKVWKIKSVMLKRSVRTKPVINFIVEKLKQLRNQRFKPKFDDDENHSLDNQIN